MAAGRRLRTLREGALTLKQLDTAAAAKPNDPKLSYGDHATYVRKSRLDVPATFILTGV